MHRIVVDEKKWVSDARFLHALSYCTLLPGPEAQQLATYLGWLMHRTIGGLMAGLLFILPGVLSIMALSIIYALWGNTGFVNALFFGLKSAVLAIVLQALVRIGKRAVAERESMLLALASFVLIFFFNVPFPVIVLGAGVIGYVCARAGYDVFRPQSHGGKPGAASHLGDDIPDHARPENAQPLRTALIWLAIWLIPVAALLIITGPASVWSTIAVFFSKMAMVTFGGAYAVLAYVAQAAVDTYGWLNPGEMLDGLGMAETTPGPLIMVLQFVGFLAAFRDPGALSPLMAGVLGGLLATWVTFAPCFLWIFLGAPYVERLRGNKALASALSAITAAVAGVILNLAIWFALHTIFRQTVRVNTFGLSFDRPVLASLDLWALVLTACALIAVFILRAGALVTLAASCAAGLALYALGLR